MPERVQQVTPIQPINDEMLTSSVAPTPARLGIPLHEVFNKDSLDKSSPHLNEKKPVDTSNQKSSSFWNSFNFWSKKSVDSAETSTIKACDSSTPSAIHALPDLDSPALSSKSLVESSTALSSIFVPQKDALTLSEMDTIRSKLENKTVHTIENILRDLIKKMWILNESQVGIESKSLKLEEQINKLHTQAIEEIKIAMEKDQWFINKANLAQTISKFAVGVASIASICVAVGLSHSYMLPFAIIGAPVAAISSGLSKFTQTYTNYRADQTAAKFTSADYLSQTSTHYIEDKRNSLDVIQDQDLSLKELFSRMIKNAHRTRKQMID